MAGYLKDLTQEDIKIFNDEFSGFLPCRILDFHVHLWKDSFYSSLPEENRKRSNPFFDAELAGGFDYEDFQFVSKTLFPQKKYTGIFFGLPFKEIDLKINNDYIAGVNALYRSNGLYVPEPGLRKIPHDFFEKGFIGFKPYPDLADKGIHKDISSLDIDVSIFDFISSEVFDFANEYGLIMLVHLPRKGRLNDKRNIEEIEKLQQNYPQIKLVLAHAGRSYCEGDIKDSIKYLKDYKNLYADTAMINSSEVLEILLSELGPEKVLFGSDLAVAAIKGKNIDINNHHYFITSKPRPWSLSSADMELGHFTYSLYEAVRSIKAACARLGLGPGDVEDIFFNNADSLVNEIKCLAGKKADK